MGEYAVRKSDGTQVKIGTCEDMYYLRLCDIEKVSKAPHSLDLKRYATMCRFRLPYPDEDHKLPGEYDEPDRGVRLYRADKNGCEDFLDEETITDAGIIQLRHESGLLVNLPCYHGGKLPEGSADVQPFWNGRSWFYELCQLRPMDDGTVKPIVRCRHCNHKWRYEWADIWEYVPAEWQRLLQPYYQVA